MNTRSDDESGQGKEGSEEGSRQRSKHNRLLSGGNAGYRAGKGKKSPGFRGRQRGGVGGGRPQRGGGSSATKKRPKGEREKKTPVWKEWRVTWFRRKDSTQACTDQKRGPKKGTGKKGTHGKSGDRKKEKTGPPPGPRWGGVRKRRKRETCRPHPKLTVRSRQGKKSSSKRRVQGKVKDPKTKETEPVGARDEGKGILKTSREKRKEAVLSGRRRGTLKKGRRKRKSPSPAGKVALQEPLSEKAYSRTSAKRKGK